MPDLPILYLPLKGEYFDQIKDGTKTEEFRLQTPYWCKRLQGREYSHIELTRGYPAKNDHEKRICRLWSGFRMKTITHPHFGPDQVRVFAIDVSEGI